MKSPVFFCHVRPDGFVSQAGNGSLHSGGNALAKIEKDILTSKEITLDQMKGCYPTSIYHAWRWRNASVPTELLGGNSSIRLLRTNIITTVWFERARFKTVCSQRIQPNTQGLMCILWATQTNIGSKVETSWAQFSLAPLFLLTETSHHQSLLCPLWTD